MAYICVGNLPFSANEALNGRDLGGRPLKVNPAEDRQRGSISQWRGR